MRTEVTSSEVERYRTDGFVILPDAFDAAELNRWRAVIDAAVEERSTPMPGNREFGDSNSENRRYYEQVFTQRVNLWQTNAAARELILDPQIGALAAQLAGVDGIRLWHDQALVKPPYGNPTAYHLDVPYWSFTSPDALSMWIALDDATPENGCLYFLPGTHLARKYDNVGIGKDLGALFDVYPEWRDATPVTAAMRAGSASFHNGLLAHGAGANMTGTPRRAMTLQFMPDGATYNDRPHMVLPADYQARLQPGDPLADDTVNPLLWPRTT